MAEIKYLPAFERLTYLLEVGADNVGEGIVAEHPKWVLLSSAGKLSREELKLNVLCHGEGSCRNT